MCVSTGICLYPKMVKLKGYCPRGSSVIRWLYSGTSSVTLDPSVDGFCRVVSRRDAGHAYRWRGLTAPVAYGYLQ